MDSDKTMPLDKEVLRQFQQTRKEQHAALQAHKERIEKARREREAKKAAEAARAHIDMNTEGANKSDEGVALDAETPGQTVQQTPGAAGVTSASPAQTTIDASGQQEALAPAGEEASSDTAHPLRAERASQSRAHTYIESDMSMPYGSLSGAATPSAQSLHGVPAQDEGLSAAETLSIYLDAFFGELERCGVHDIVVSPGSRSTPLAMKAYERFGEVFVDVDERGAAFFALGRAKATQKIVVLICTSGSAPANWYPAILEAESSRVPLLVLSADRPARLQQVGAPQTTDQLGMFGSHVRKFVQMPEPSSDERVIEYARHMALEACIAAYGSHPGLPSADAAPVHYNFPFDEPLVPARGVVPVSASLPPTVVPQESLTDNDMKGLLKALRHRRVLAVCGEGSAPDAASAQSLIDFAHMRHVPLIADVLSGLRGYDDPYVIDTYDTLLAQSDEQFSFDALVPEVIIRFGRWPVSKRLMQFLGGAHATQIVVDVRDTRDTTVSTELFVRTSAHAFVESLTRAYPQVSADVEFCEHWRSARECAAHIIDQVRIHPSHLPFEGAYMHALMSIIPDNSPLFCANSMSVRVIDTFYTRNAKHNVLLGNRGLNGIDGTISSALGVASAYGQSTLVIGDLAMLHDINALALQGELMSRVQRLGEMPPSLTIVLMNNNGGSIFDMLPQQSEEPYFERLFLTPQQVNFRSLCAGFGVGYEQVASVTDFVRTYGALVGAPGIHVIEVNTPLTHVKERFSPYW